MPIVIRETAANTYAAGQRGGPGSRPWLLDPAQAEKGVAA